uniref:PDZK1-interacting protein 1 n=1 Tax=Rhinolophus ferrumequinum TaxID=59479 RepID=A0A671DWL9_RHIFE
MPPLMLVLLGVLMAAPPASCQQGLGNLQPWMQGLIAMAVFLVLVAIVFAVNRFWCQEEPEPMNTVVTMGNKADGILAGTEGKYSSMAASFRYKWTPFLDRRTTWGTTERGLVGSGVNWKHSRIKATATFNSIMANCCPTQFL